MDILRGFIGLLFLLVIAFLLSNNKRFIRWRIIATGLFLQILFGILITRMEWAQDFFNFISLAFVRLLSFSTDGAKFLFGGLADEQFGYIFAFRVLPTVIFFSSLTSGLYYLGILQKFVKGIAWIMTKTMRLSGAESLSAAANIFIGQTEAPMLVRPFIAGMTRSELMCLMTGGMATIAGGVMAAYVAFLGGNDPVERIRFASYLLSASIMNAPAAIVMSKIILPETDYDKIDQRLIISKENIGVNLIDSLARGASDGVKLALNIGGMLLAFIALIFLLNFLLNNLVGEWTGINGIIEQSTNGQFSGLTLQYVFGQAFRIFAFAMGVPWNETLFVGSLIGQKTVINEFVAYVSLSEMIDSGILSQRSIVVSTYALCGFANLSSIAIQIGGIGGMAPSRQGDLSKLGIRALVAASLATMMTATIAGVLMS